MGLEEINNDAITVIMNAYEDTMKILAEKLKGVFLDCFTKFVTDAEEDSDNGQQKVRELIVSIDHAMTEVINTSYQQMKLDIFVKSIKHDIVDYTKTINDKKQMTLSYYKIYVKLQTIKDLNSILMRQLVDLKVFVMELFEEILTETYPIIRSLKGGS